MEPGRRERLLEVSEKADAQRREVRGIEPRPRGAATDVIADDPFDTGQEGSAAMPLYSHEIVRWRGSDGRRPVEVRVVDVAQGLNRSDIVACGGANEGGVLVGHLLWAL
eukprot:354128_1